MDNLELRADISDIKESLRNIEEMLKCQKVSMDNLDKHVTFVEEVYEDLVKSPIDWLYSTYSSGTNHIKHLTQLK